MTGWLLSAKIMKLKSTTATTIRKLEIKLNLKKTLKHSLILQIMFTWVIKMKTKVKTFVSTIFFFFFLAHFHFKSICQQERRKRSARFTPRTHAQ